MKNRYWLSNLCFGVILTLGLGACSMSNTGDEVDAQLNTGYFTAQNVESETCLKLNRGTGQVTTETCNRNDPEKLWRFKESSINTGFSDYIYRWTQMQVKANNRCLAQTGNGVNDCRSQKNIFHNSSDRTLLNDSGKCLTWTRGWAASYFQPCNGTNSQKWVLN